MVRVFRPNDKQESDESLWSFSYTDWQGKAQVAVGTESRMETQRLAQRVQAEHDMLRRGMREKKPGSPVAAQEMNDWTEATSQDEKTEVAPATDAVRDDAPPVTGEVVIRNDLIGEQLIAASIITREQLSNALAFQDAHGGKIIDVLIQQGSLTADRFLVFMGRQPGIPRIVLENYRDIPMDVLELVPRELALEHELIPIDRMGSVVTVAMVCPVDQSAIAAIRKHTSLKVRPVLCSWADFRDALWRHYGVMARRKFQAKSS